MKIEVKKEIGKCKEISTNYRWKDKPTDINELMNYLTQAQSEGATHIEFGGEVEWDTRNNLEELWLQPVHIRLESDEEYKSRLKKENLQKEELEKEELEKERLEFERLKQKFGNE